MADFEQAINNLLSNPEAMGQIMNLAGMLEGKENSPPASEETPSPSSDSSDFSDLSDASDSSDKLGDTIPIEPLLKLLNAYQNTDEQSAALLSALRPFLREERRDKLDRAIRLAGLSRAARQAYRLWKGGELHL